MPLTSPGGEEANVCNVVFMEEVDLRLGLEDALDLGKQCRVDRVECSFQEAATQSHPRKIEALDAQVHTGPESPPSKEPGNVLRT